MVGRGQVEFFRGLVVFVDDAAVCAGELDRAGGDGCEHRLQVKRRADRPADFRQGL